MVFSSSKEWLRHAASIVTSRARASLPFTVAKLPLAHGDRPHTRTTWRPLSTLVVVAALAACGGGGDGQQPAPQSEVPNEVIRGTLTATGGAVLAVPSNSGVLAGATVDIPAEASKGHIEVQIGYELDPPGPFRGEAIAAQATPVSKTIILKVANGGPSTFNRPVTVTIPYDVAAAGGLPPAVVYWDPVASRYRPVAVVGVDRSKGTVTFHTSHFSKYMAVVVKKLGAAMPDVDTGFRRGVDSILHSNFSYYGNGGVCAAFASMSTFYYGLGKPKGLYEFAQQGAVEQPLDDELTRNAMLMTYALLSSIWNGEVIENRFFLSATDAGVLVAESMIITGDPVHLTLRGLDVAHSVTVYGYDATLARFRVYDSNFPKDDVTFDWNLISGFGAYSKAAAYPLTMFSRVGYATDNSFGAPDQFQKIIADWESGKLTSYFSNLQITDTNGSVRALTYGSEVTATIPFADSQFITGQFNRPVGSVKPVYLHVYHDGAKQGEAGSLIDASGIFTLNFANRLDKKIEVMILVSEAERDTGTGLTAFGKFTVQPEGKNFLINFGFERGDITGWSGQTTLLNTGAESTPLKIAVVGVGFDPIATDLPTTVIGTHAARINDKTPNYHSTFIAQKAVVPASGNPQLNFKWAAVLQDPEHDPSDQPYVDVTVRNLTKGIDLYRKRYFTSDPSFTGWKDYQGGTWKAIPWQSVVLSGLASYAGDEIELRIEGADCALGGHGGYVYLDGEE